MARARTSETDVVPSTARAARSTEATMASSVVSVSWPKASAAAPAPMRTTMPATTTAAQGSSQWKPSLAKKTPTSATTEDQTSLRWWMALARTTGELRRLPTSSVTRNRSSLETMEAMHAPRASRPGPETGEAQVRQKASRRSVRASAPMPMPARITNKLTPNAPTASKRPWPYGWSESGGIWAMRTAQSVTPSLTRSDTECPASAIKAAELLSTPATSFAAASSTFTATASQVTRSAPPAAERRSGGGRCRERASWTLHHHSSTPLRRSRLFLPLGFAVAPSAPAATCAHMAVASEPIHGALRPPALGPRAAGDAARRRPRRYPSSAAQST
mmetsp:Transcript_48792/g.98372  ORF Transcript_48792/g.98372 Transcript_48792/m.98372 type:complete len:332 (-) Transcript_48792:160-1155(-)